MYRRIIVDYKDLKHGFGLCINLAWLKNLGDNETCIVDSDLFIRKAIH